MKDSLDFLLEHRATGYEMLIAKSRHSEGIVRIVNYLQPFDVKKWRACGLTSMTQPDEYRDKFHTRFEIFERKPPDTRQVFTCPCYLPWTCFMTPDGDGKLVQHLQPGDLVTLLFGQEASVQHVTRLPYQKYDCIELTVGQEPGPLTVTEGHLMSVVKEHVPPRTEFKKLKDSQVEDRPAGSLKKGDKVIYGNRVTTLFNVCPREKETVVFHVVFSPDSAVPTLWARPSEYGILTKGDPPSEPRASQSASSSLEMSPRARAYLESWERMPEEEVKKAQQLRKDYDEYSDSNY